MYVKSMLTLEECQTIFFFFWTLVTRVRDGQCPEYKDCRCGSHSDTWGSISRLEKPPPPGLGEAASQPVAWKKLAYATGVSTHASSLEQINHENFHVCRLWWTLVCILISFFPK